MRYQESNVTASAKANQDTVSRFYQAFQERDAEAMNACYTPAIKFGDPVFGPLERDRARAMWQMLNRPGAGSTGERNAGRVQRRLPEVLAWPNEVDQV